MLAAGIRRRPAGAPLTVVCCDNMASNGDTLRKLLVQYAGAARSRAGAAHRERHRAARTAWSIASCPPPRRSRWRGPQQRLGLRDEAAIVCEPFTQWVIEDRFAGARPAWEDAGALLTDDVRPYQAMKLRLLNGTHSAIAYAGQLRGLDSVSDAMARPAGRPVRAPADDGRPARHGRRAGRLRRRRYCEQLLHRFENPALAHRTQQIAMDGTQKVPVRWLPALRESAAAGIERPWLERALAVWLHYLTTRAQRRRDGARRSAIPARRRWRHACAVPRAAQTQYNERWRTPASSATCRGRRR